MANEQQATPSVDPDTAIPDEESAEAKREQERHKIMQAISDELCGYFRKQVEGDGHSFSINLDHDSDVGTSQNGDDQNAEGWTVTFNLSERDPENDEELRIGFEVQSTPRGIKDDSFEVSKEGKGYFSFKNHGDYIDINFYNGKTYSILNINEENEVVEENLALDSYKPVRSEILEVWFPSPKSKTTALQRPVSLNDKKNADWIGVESPHWIKIEDELEVEIPALTVEDNGINTNFEEWWNVIRSIISYWTVAAIYSEDRLLYFLTEIEDDNSVSSSEKKKLSEKHWGLPPKYLFEPVRPVNLNPSDVISDLENKKLYFPWHVIESACAALNAGKNVIFTGPPGCGKSKLSSFLAKKATDQPPLMATASPAWTSGDLIGRYMPARNGKGLVFREGFLLRAVPQSGMSKWLIIDEFNRADIDSCFGELFSVLAGDAVQLPFEKLNESGEDQIEEGKEAQSTSFVRIVPATADNVEEQAEDYRVPRRFRLIGTMNDADRSGLNTLSFALMRRFAFIPVEAPDNETIRKKVIKAAIDQVREDIGIDGRSWTIVDDRSSKNPESDINLVKSEINRLFASSSSDFGNLISSRTVGISVIKDVIRFVGEGIRAPNVDDDKRAVDCATAKNVLPELSNKKTDRKATAEILTLSYLSLALVLEIFPQLESLARGQDTGESALIQAIKHIFFSLHKDDSGKVRKSASLPMLRIKKNDDSDNSEWESILKSDQTIAQFLFENLKTRLPNLDASHLRDELAKEDWAEDNWDSKEL